MNRIVLISLLLALGSSGASMASVYRCDDGGHLRFSDRPCVAGQDPLAIARPNTMETSAGDEVLAREYDARIARQRRIADARPAKEKAGEIAAVEKKPRKPKKGGAARKHKAVPLPPSREREPAYIGRPAR